MRIGYSVPSAQLLLGVVAGRSSRARAVVSCYVLAKNRENQCGRRKGEMERGKAGEGVGEGKEKGYLRGCGRSRGVGSLTEPEVEFGNQDLSRTKFSR